ncbi:MAG: hypothetical protein HY827_07290 [Actinobacteria bacterium]|nr:hypothetical protein [Actinomycetota bacterium]
MTRFARLSALLLAIGAIFAAVATQAYAVNPEATIGGKWFSGSLLMQSGTNCSTAILGDPYSETMVSAIASYGGDSSGGVARVGNRYYASLLISVPGNPCGSGTSVIGTDLVLPRGTTVDTSAPIRCFGKPRNSNDFGELTGGIWTMPADMGGGSGEYCPATVSGPLTGYGQYGVGFRPVVSGQMYQIFVPIKSTQTLEGAAHSPADEITWILSSSGTYDQFGATKVWTNVFSSGGGSGPFLYFARNPSVVPFWDKTKPAGQENRAEWFANLYSDFKAGTFCWEYYPHPTATGSPQFTCNSPIVTWNGSVTNASDLWQIYGTGEGAGPNGGYVPPLVFDPSETGTVRWTFTPTSPPGPTIFKDVTFTTLSGPDNDGDGVVDAQDACPAVKGTESNGCQPAVQPDTDKDGIFGAADKCPNENGAGSLDGCPKAGALIGGDVGPIAGNKFKRKALVKGVSLPLTCRVNAKATGLLTITAKVAKKLKLKVKRKAKTVTIGTGTADCAGTGGGTLTLKLSKTAKKKVLKARKGFAATLTITFVRSGSTDVVVTRPLKLT